MYDASHTKLFEWEFWALMSLFITANYYAVWIITPILIADSRTEKYEYFAYLKSQKVSTDFDVWNRFIP